MIEKNSLMTGLLLGAVTPVVGFLVTEFVFEILTYFNLMEEVSASVSERRMRTLTLLALCFNLIPFNISKKYRWDQTMRGLVIPTVIYAGAWIYMYKHVLFYF
jgi:hypothetical protein